MPYSHSCTHCIIDAHFVLLALDSLSSLPPYRPLFLSLDRARALSFTLFPSPPLVCSRSFSLCLALSPSISRCLYPSLSLFLSLSLSSFISLMPLSLSLAFSFCFSFALLFARALSLSFSPPLSFSLPLPFVLYLRRSTVSGWR